MIRPIKRVYDKPAKEDGMRIIKATSGRRTIQTVVKVGDFEESMLQTETEMNADIILIGTYSRNGLDSTLPGSVAEKVLHHSSIPSFNMPAKSLK